MKQHHQYSCQCRARRKSWGALPMLEEIYTVVGVWNALPEVVVGADMIVAFKRLLDTHVNM